MPNTLARAALCGLLLLNAPIALAQAPKAAAAVQVVPVPSIPPIPGVPGTDEKKESKESKDERELEPEERPELLMKMTPEQTAAYLETRSRTKRWNNFVDLGTPLIFFGFLGGVIGLSLWLSYRKDQRRHETLRLMLEKGTPILPEVVDPRTKKPNDRRRGILLLTGGAGFSLYMAASHDSSWSVGIVPMLLGVGYLLAWKLDSKDRGAA